MGAGAIDDVVAYLRRIAPDLAGRMRGAREADIVRLELSAEARLADSYRAFLRVMGATPAGAMAPFLLHLDCHVETLLAWHARFPTPLPRNVSVFSDDRDHDTIFLRHGDDPRHEPELGELSYDDGQVELGLGRWLPHVDGRFEGWLQRAAFDVRLARGPHEVSLVPRWDAAREIWEGDASALAAPLIALGFAEVFRLPDDGRCLDRGDVAVKIYRDGSGRIVGEDVDELQRLVAIMRG